MQRVHASLRPDVKSIVIDAEAVAYDKEKKKILPFQVGGGAPSVASGPCGLLSPTSCNPPPPLSPSPLSPLSPLSDPVHAQAQGRGG